MTAEPADVASLRERAGLCGRCGHALLRPTNRGTAYLRCALAAVDQRFARYPRLPVTLCAGYRPASDADGPAH